MSAGARSRIMRKAREMRKKTSGGVSDGRWLRARPRQTRQFCRIARRLPSYGTARIFRLFELRVCARPTHRTTDHLTNSATASSNGRVRTGGRKGGDRGGGLSEQRARRLRQGSAKGEGVRYARERSRRASNNAERRRTHAVSLCVPKRAGNLPDGRRLTLK